MVIGLEEIGFSGLAGVGVAKIWTLGFGTIGALKLYQRVAGHYFML